MYTPEDVKKHIDSIIADLDRGKAPRRPKIPWWVRAVAGPAAVGVVTVGLAACDTDTPEGEEITKNEAAESKIDGFTDSLCEIVGAEMGCDICGEMGWYGDGVCDTFCEAADTDCTEIVPLYGVPVLECETDADCPDGTQCMTTSIVGECPPGAYCILPPMTEGTCEPVVECSADAECPDGAVCFEGECVVEVMPLYGVPMMECDADSDCPEGTRCVTPDVGDCPPGAYCILPPGGFGTCEPVVECTDDADCGPDQECMIDSVGDCPEGAYCILPPSTTGVCVDGGDEIVPLYGVPILECDDDADCPDGTQCVSDVGECPEGAYCILPAGGLGSCEPVAECVDDADCDDGMICNDGGCEFGMVPLYGVPTLECDADADCPDGTRCVSPEGDCPEGAYCILPPSGTGTCEPVVECSTDADCPDGAECLVVGECPEGAYCILPPGAPGTCISS